MQLRNVLIVAASCIMATNVAAQAVGPQCTVGVPATQAVFDDCATRTVSEQGGSGITHPTIEDLCVTTAGPTSTLAYYSCTCAQYDMLIKCYNSSPGCKDDPAYPSAQAAQVADCAALGKLQSSVSSSQSSTSTSAATTSASVSVASTTASSTSSTQGSGPILPAPSGTANSITSATSKPSSGALGRVIEGGAIALLTVAGIFMAVI